MEERFQEHLRVVAAAKRQIETLENIADMIAFCFRNNGTLFIIGNGGSAADAQHIACELVGTFKKKNRSPFPALALTTDSSILTAVSNDLGFEYVFARQLGAFAKPDDVVWALSTSGQSKNILMGLLKAQQIGCYRVGFTGAQKTEIHDVCDFCFTADSEESDRVQEVHQLAYHLICERVEQRMTVDGNHSSVD